MQSATLRVLLAWLDVLVDQVHAFYDQGIGFMINRQDLARDRFVFAADDFNLIAAVNFHSYF